MMARMAVIEKLRTVPAAVLEPHSNTAMENCDKEWKTPPNTRTARKRLYLLRRRRKKKRSANGSSPMKSEGHFDPVLQAHLDEMKEPKE
jgi:hypothetical protein